MTTPPVTPVRPGGMASNVAAAVSYITIIPAVIFLVLEPYRRDPFVRFHAWQSIFFFIIAFIINLIMRLVPFPVIGGYVWDVVALALFIVWLIAIIKAFQGQKWGIPGIGPYSERQASRVTI